MIFSILLLIGLYPSSCASIDPHTSCRPNPNACLFFTPIYLASSLSPQCLLRFSDPSLRSFCLSTFDISHPSFPTFDTNYFDTCLIQ